MPSGLSSRHLSPIADFRFRKDVYLWPRRPRIERGVRLLILVPTLLLAAVQLQAATRYDWRLRFRTLHTAHFDIHAHQGLEALARHLAEIVEDVRASLQPTLGLPRGRVQVILVDQTDLSNGWANPFPFDTIEIAALSPTADTLIGNADDWLRVAFSHEYTHILHLDRSRGLMNGVRRVFGRAPFVFPNLFLPVWQIEGIATFEESQVTHQGRVPTGDFRVIVDEAARRARFEPQDRAAGGLIAWPSGLAAYAYGAYFHQYLADRYGADRLTALADATAGRVPFFGAPAFKNVFGRSVGQLWNDFRDSRSDAVSDAEPDRSRGSPIDASRLQRVRTPLRRRRRRLLWPGRRRPVSIAAGADAGWRHAHAGDAGRGGPHDRARSLDRVRSGRAGALDGPLLRFVRAWRSTAESRAG